MIRDSNARLINKIARCLIVPSYLTTAHEAPGISHHGVTSESRRTARRGAARQARIGTGTEASAVHTISKSTRNSGTEIGSRVHESESVSGKCRGTESYFDHHITSSRRTTRWPPSPAPPQALLRPLLPLVVVVVVVLLAAVVATALAVARWHFSPRHLRAPHLRQLVPPPLPRLGAVVEVEVDARAQ